MRLWARNRRNSNRDIFEQLNEYTAKTTNDNRSEQRIALDPENYLYTLRSHALHRNTGDVGGGELSRHALSNAEECITNFRGARETQLYTPNVALVTDLSRLDL